MADIPEFLTMKEVQAALKIGQTQAYSLVVDQRQIPYLRIGRNIRVSKQALEDFLKRNTVQRRQG